MAGGQVSRYSDRYYADVVEVTGNGYLLQVQIDAHGAADLRRPETSCVHIVGDDNNGYVSAPTQRRHYRDDHRQRHRVRWRVDDPR